VLNLLRSICRQDGIAAIVSLHQLEYARQFSDRVIGLADGQVVFDGSAAELNDAHLGRIYGGQGRPPAGNKVDKKEAYVPPFLEPRMETSL
jgi:phosphonate transport system ATP-binding protein